MNKENILLSCAERILYTDNLEKIYRKLLPIFENAGLYQEQIGILERIYYIKKDPELFHKIGDIALEKLKNREFAKLLYNKFLSLKHPEFYKNYIFVTEPDFLLPSENNFEPVLQNFINKYVLLIYIMVYLKKNKKYSEILQIASILDEMGKRLEAYSGRKLNTFEDINDANNHLSYLLSQKKHHNDINRLAIKLNPNNETAYLNIIDDFVVFENYKEALEFYRNEYSNAFSMSRNCSSIVDIFWFLSDKYSASKNYYTSTLRQQKAIELELNSEGV